MKSNLLIAVFLFGVSFLPFRVNAACNVITPQDTPVDLYYFAKLNSGGSCSFIKFRSYDVLFNVNTNSFLDDGYASPCSIPLSPYTKLHLSLDLLKTENTAFDYFRYIAGRIQSIGFICDDTVTIGAYNNGYGRIIYYPGFFRQPTFSAAALDVHEARHSDRDAAMHIICNGPNGSILCDPGAFSGLNGGAMSYGVLFWLDYAYNATTAPRAFREWARNLAIADLNLRFAVPSNWTPAFIPRDSICKPGTITNINDTTGVTPCLPCPAGSFNPQGTDSCLPCRGNTVSRSGSSRCEACLPGEIASLDKTRCVGCPAYEVVTQMGNTRLVCRSCRTATNPNAFPNETADTCMTCNGPISEDETDIQSRPPAPGICQPRACATGLKPNEAGFVGDPCILNCQPPSYPNDLNNRCVFSKDATLPNAN